MDLFKVLDNKDLNGYKVLYVLTSTLYKLDIIDINGHLYRYWRNK